MQKNLIKKLGFAPKENTKGIFWKKYAAFGNYCIEADFEQEKINFGDLIIAEQKTTLHFSPNENWVVLECVNRLLEKGYPPQNIILEKTWSTGHGTSGRLDILVTRDDGSAYLMIECKTWGNEFEKELKRIEKDGGQLFTYFQQDKNADILMLYASGADDNGINYRSEIIKIEADYRQAGNVKDFHERWNKLRKSNGFFESWVSPYEFQSKALTKKDLKALKQEDSSFIFNRFLEILRRHAVSDKSNAFNKIFTLFLCKIIDEDRNDDEQLHFQWIEGEDTHISFQKRLADLHNRGMLELLEKKVTDISDVEFEKQFQPVEDRYKEKFKEILTEIRLKKNSEFAVKEVYDEASFLDNAKAVKEVVELLQVYQLRYSCRQQFLSDFFELLLTTGLKQESGQFFTPVPVARFIIKSLPFHKIIEQKLRQGNPNDLLPAIIDYAAGSGHFITESMEEIQKHIDAMDENQYAPTAKRALKKWKEVPFDWAKDYVYGVEKDYRLAKTAKVSCYLHGDGLAKVIHGDGLGDFNTSKEFKDLLKNTDKTYPQDNKQFDAVISNPPYSVAALKRNMTDDKKAKQAFELYSRLTDQSSEIECLFIERAKQLLKDGGVAGIILPHSILDNGSVLNIQTREIMLRYFDIIAIMELGANTFMATDVKTVIFFLRRKNNADFVNVKASVDKFFQSYQDITINGIEKPIHEYVSQIWGGIAFRDFVALLEKRPNREITEHDIYKEYAEKFSGSQTEKLEQIIVAEKEKTAYFIMAYPQRLVYAKTGEKNDEKQFLGYEFSSRRGSEGIRPIKKGSTIEACTSLYDSKDLNHSEKANYYISQAFKGNVDLPVPDSLNNHIEYLNLFELLDFTEVDFCKKIKKTTKANIKYEEAWGTANLTALVSIADIKKGKSITKAQTAEGRIPVIAGGQNPAYFHNQSNRDGNIITVSASGAYAGFLNYFDAPIFASDCNTIKSKDEKLMPTRLLFYFLKALQPQFYQLQRGQAQPHVYGNDIEKVKIPLFTDFKITHKILEEIDALEAKAKTHVVADIDKQREQILKKYL